MIFDARQWKTISNLTIKPRYPKAVLLFKFQKKC